MAFKLVFVFLDFKKILTKQTMLMLNLNFHYRKYSNDQGEVDLKINLPEWWLIKRGTWPALDIWLPSEIWSSTRRKLQMCVYESRCSGDWQLVALLFGCKMAGPLSYELGRVEKSPVFQCLPFLPLCFNSTVSPKWCAFMLTCAVQKHGKWEASSR